MECSRKCYRGEVLMKMTVGMVKVGGGGGLIWDIMACLTVSSAAQLCMPN